jgi:DNA-binding HxlR family transcriptional regulator
MAPLQYPQFCALARAAEILGERWTLLIVRELLLGPKRFSDLRARLDSISTSVLAARLARLEGAGVVRRTFLEPPAASTVYELTDDGRALEGAVFELIRWGARFLLPPRPGDRLEPDWLRLALAACARRAGTPLVSFEVRIPAGEKAVVVRVAGGPQGTRVTEGSGPADAVITADAWSVIGLVGGITSPTDALKDGQIDAEGDLTALPLFPQLFDVTAGREENLAPTEEL